MTVLSRCDYQFLSLASLEASKSTQQHRHGAVAVINGKIRGRGHNSGRTKSCDGFINNTCSCHAEVAAIRNVFQNNTERAVTKLACKNNKWVLCTKAIQKNHTLCRKNRHKWKL